MSTKNHLVWIKDGGHWRPLTAHETEKEAREVALHYKRCGDEVKYVYRGDLYDRHKKNNSL